MNTTSQSGFSLTEVLVAMMVFSIISVLSVTMLTNALSSRDIQTDVNNSVDAMQRVRTLFRDDAGQMVLRTWRDQDGLRQPLVFAGSLDGVDPLMVTRTGEGRDILILTRRGWANPGGIHDRSSLQRIVWRLENSQLVRVAWPHPDITQNTQPVRTVLMTNLENLRIEFLAGETWTDEARVMITGDGEASGGPRALRLSYTLDGLGEIEHIALTPFAELGR